MVELDDGERRWEITEFLARFHKDTNPSCECFEDPNNLLVVIRNPRCPVHGRDEDSCP